MPREEEILELAQEYCDSRITYAEFLTHCFSGAKEDELSKWLDNMATHGDGEGIACFT